MIEKPRSNASTSGGWVEKELETFIAKRHDQRVREEGGDRAAEELWRESERREAAKREQERYLSTLVAERHLRDVYFRRFEEKKRIVSELEGGAVGTTPTPYGGD